jgi:hypothetical protein
VATNVKEIGCIIHDTKHEHYNIDCEDAGRIKPKSTARILIQKSSHVTNAL